MYHSTEDKIRAILKWSEHQNNFDASFVESMSNRNRPLTPKQDQAIDNIIDGFEIDVEEWRWK